MLSVWALAIDHGERVFAQRGEELESEAASRAEALVTANAGLQAEAHTLRVQLEDQQTRLASALADLARAQAERDTLRAQSEQALRDARSAHRA